MRVDTDMKDVSGNDTISGPIHDAKSLIAIWKIRYSGADRFREWRWMFGETVTWQDAGSGSERSAADVPFATRSKVKTTDKKFDIKFFCSEAASGTSHG